MNIYEFAHLYFENVLVLKIKHNHLVYYHLQFRFSEYRFFDYLLTRLKISCKHVWLE